MDDFTSWLEAGIFPCPGDANGGRTIDIVPLGDVRSDLDALCGVCGGAAGPNNVLDELAGLVSAFFMSPVRVLPAVTDAATAKEILVRSVTHRWGPQLEAGSCLELLKRMRDPSSCHVIVGVTLADLTDGQLAYLFGEGSPIDRAAIFSFLRYLRGSTDDEGEDGDNDEDWGEEKGGRALSHEAQVAKIEAMPWYAAGGTPVTGLVGKDRASRETGLVGKDRASRETGLVGSRRQQNQTSLETRLVWKPD